MNKKADKVIYMNRGWQPAFIGFCPTKRAWNREMKRLGVSRHLNPYPDSDGRVTIFSKPDAPPICIMTIKKHAETRRNLAEIVGIITHESAHVWQEIQQYIGETSPGAEMEAYALQAITQAMLTAFHETRGLPPPETIGCVDMEKSPSA